VPRVLFSLMLERLGQFPKSKDYKSIFLSIWGGKWALHSFLARRCSKEFLEMYIKANPGCLDEIVKPGLMLSAMAEVGLVVTLNKLGILPEEHRRQFIETVSQYAVDGNDLTAMNNKSIRTVFKDEEFDELKEQVCSELLPRLEKVRENVELNHRLDEPPEEHMSSLMETFDTLTLTSARTRTLPGLSTGRGGTPTSRSESINLRSRSASRGNLAIWRNQRSHGVVGASSMISMTI